jgi:hypothetical protein
VHIYIYIHKGRCKIRINLVYGYLFQLTLGSSIISSEILIKIGRMLETIACTKVHGPHVYFTPRIDHGKYMQCWLKLCSKQFQGPLSSENDCSRFGCVVCVWSPPVRTTFIHSWGFLEPAFSKGAAQELCEKISRHSSDFYILAAANIFPFYSV